tara:strand:- start:425 stop:598 length:174 start_codon:yes stop_codon:yes gene_type:complete
MTITYKKFKDPYGNVVTSAINKFIDGVHVLCLPFDEANTDYQEYLEWAKTNTAEEAD